MIQTERDVIIVGAGPAGAICAAYLARTGVDVLLIDKEIFPRDKTCGGLLRETLVTHINELGAFDQLDAMGTCIRNLRLMSSSGREATVPFECYSVPRYDLDHLLVKTAVRWGAEFRQGCRMADIIRERDFVRGVKVKCRGEEMELRSKLVIGADGACSPFAKALGIMKENSGGMYLGQRAYFKGVKLDRSLARGQYEAYGVFSFDASVRPDYFWILPTGRRGVADGYCSVGMLTRDRDAYRAPSLQQRFEQWRINAPAIAEMLATAEQVSPWRGGKLADMTQGIQAAGNGFLVIGDAGACMQPLYHDGLSAAADSARGAATAAAEAIRTGRLSGAQLTVAYDAAMADCRPSEDERKERRLTIESMYDPSVMDLVVQRLENDLTYRRQIIEQMSRG